jgi:hypothetical protein
MPHMRAALYIAKRAKPMTDFKELCEMNRKNQVKCIEGHDGPVRCGEFLDCLEQAMTQYITQIIAGVDFFGLLFDGSQARKTGHEKELIFIKIVVG